jgi:hypothetical protein
LAHSRYIRDANFTAIHPWDLEFLFKAYDDRFFAGLCGRTLDGRRIKFRLAPRLTKAGGKTTRFTAPTGEVSYEIAIAISILFDGFGTLDRRIARKREGPCTSFFPTPQLPHSMDFRSAATTCITFSTD